MNIISGQGGSMEAGTPRVLITGATGKVGGGAAEILVKLGVPVRLYVRDAEKAAALREAGVDVAIGSLEDQDSFARACEDIDSVLLVPPDANVAAADFTIAPALSRDVRRVVRITAQGATDDAPSELLRAHAVGEKKLESSGLQFHHLRCNNFYQNISFFFSWIADSDTIFACLGDKPVSWIDSRDISAAAAALLMSDTRQSSAHILNGPVPMTSFDIADLVSARLGRRISCTSLSPASFIDTAVSHGWPRDFASEWVAMFADDYWGTGRGGGSDADLRQLIGREPQRMADYLREIEFGTVTETYISI